MELQKLGIPILGLTHYEKAPYIFVFFFNSDTSQES